MSEPGYFTFPENPWDTRYDAVVAAPDSHQVLFETDELRVLEVIIPPGVTELPHHHAGRSTMAVFAATAIRIYDLVEGITIDVPRRAATEDEPIVQAMGPEGMHQIQNLDPVHTYRAVRIERKL